jgi:lantibiotic transport system permease protein
MVEAKGCVMLKLVLIEAQKLSRSLAVLLCVLAPLLVAIVSAMIALRQGKTGWSGMITNTFALWCFFVLPMLVATLSALLAQVEHGPRMWDHLFTLPISRQQMLMAKGIILMVMILGTGFALCAYIILLGTMFMGGDVSRIPWRGFGFLVALTTGASTLMAAIQLSIALWIRSFIAPIALGLAGTFVLVASMGAPETSLLPWSLPMSAFPKPGGNPELAILIGLLGGLVVYPIAAVFLARRDQS